MLGGGDLSRRWCRALVGVLRLSPCGLGDLERGPCHQALRPGAGGRASRSRASIPPVYTQPGQRSPAPVWGGSRISPPGRRWGWVWGGAGGLPAGHGPFLHRRGRTRDEWFWQNWLGCGEPAPGETRMVRGGCAGLPRGSHGTPGASGWVHRVGPRSARPRNCLSRQGHFRCGLVSVGNRQSRLLRLPASAFG